jgi:15-cis-phytoene synthase
MCSLYAFCREVDDVADADEVPTSDRRQALLEWREDVRQAATGGAPQFPVNQELKPVIKKYGLSFDLFDELLKGVESDLDTFRYQTDADLQAYCYRVASVVGLLSIEIFGYQSSQCHDYAVKLGLALQYTNILRDVWSDAKRGRIYLPLEDLHRFGVTENEILTGVYSERYGELAREVSKRARQFYAEAARLLPTEDRGSMVAAEMMGRVYWQLLVRLESRQFDVFSDQRIRVSKPHKIFLLLLTWLNTSLGLGSQPYRQVASP